MDQENGSVESGVVVVAGATSIMPPSVRSSNPADWSTEVDSGDGGETETIEISDSPPSVKRNRVVNESSSSPTEPNGNKVRILDI